MRINGVLHYLWRAVDRDSYEIDIPLNKTDQYIDLRDSPYGQ